MVNPAVHTYMTYMYVCTYMYMYVCMYVHVHVCTCNVCMYVCMYVHVYPLIKYSHIKYSHTKYTDALHTDTTHPTTRVCNVRTATGDTLLFILIIHVHVKINSIATSKFTTVHLNLLVQCS